MKIVVPCDVEIRRFYRTYVTVDEDTSDAEIVLKAKAEILEHQDAVLSPDPDLDIEAHDILNVCLDSENWLEDMDDEGELYTRSSYHGDYSPGNPWDAPGMSIRDFI